MNTKNKIKSVEEAYQRLTKEIDDLRAKIQEKEVERIELRGQYKLLEEMDKK